MANNRNEKRCTGCSEEIKPGETYFRWEIDGELCDYCWACDHDLRSDGAKATDGAKTVKFISAVESPLPDYGWARGSEMIAKAYECENLQSGGNIWIAMKTLVDGKYLVFGQESIGLYASQASFEGGDHPLVNIDLFADKESIRTTGGY